MTKWDAINELRDRMGRTEDALSRGDKIHRFHGGINEGLRRTCWWLVHLPARR